MTPAELLKNFRMAFALLDDSLGLDPTGQPVEAGPGTARGVIPATVDPSPDIQRFELTSDLLAGAMAILGTHENKYEPCVDAGPSNREGQGEPDRVGAESAQGQLVIHQTESSVAT
jgi:hypothetical protein